MAKKENWSPIKSGVRLLEWRILESLRNALGLVTYSWRGNPVNVLRGNPIGIEVTQHQNGNQISWDGEIQPAIDGSYTICLKTYEALTAANGWIETKIVIRS